MGYASQLASKYNADTAWSYLGTNLFGGYGARDYARAPYAQQTFRNVVGNTQEPSNYRVKAISNINITPSSNNMFDTMQTLQNMPYVLSEYPAQLMQSGLAGKYVSLF